MGIYIQSLRDADGKQAHQGANPFSDLNVGGTSLSSIVKAYAPPYSDSRQVYGYIKENLSDWIEEAVEIRAKYGSG